MKKSIRLASLLFALLILVQIPVSAASIDGVSVSEVIFNPDAEFLTFAPSNGMRNTKTVRIPLVGMSSIIEFDTTLDDSVAEYTTSNPDVVVAYDARILAIGVGTATVTISINDMVQRVNVIVEDELTRAEVEQLDCFTFRLASSESVQRQSMAQKAIDMVYYRWTPEYNLTGWRERYTYYANTTYTGLPYSMTVYQCDDDDFEAALDYSDFYDDYTYLSKTMPKYGNDCSAFVAICWGLPYRTGRYTTYTFMQNYDELPNGYSDLQKGDAVVYSDHIMLVTQNHEYPSSSSGYSESYVAVYEQTPPYAQLTFWTYAQLESVGYEAISYFD